MRAPRLVLVFCLLAAVVAAQEFRASIAGTVSDPSGAPVPNARVAVTSVSRGTTTESQTNDAGRYLVQFLLPDRYNLAVEKEGFKKFVRDGLNLQAADRLGLDIRLDLGAVAESITVSGEAPQLQTETATRVATIENKFIDNVPTSGRQLYQFHYTLPGALKASNYWGDFELYAFGNINGLIINGGRVRENETLIDGVPATLPDRGVAYVPALQSVQELSIQSNTYDAQYGRVGGGVTSITLKSGTNGLHGQLFHFLEHDKLYGTAWFDSARGLRKTPFRQNVFGFELDGPIYVPKLIDGRNKVFFMISLEGLRERNPNSISRKFPTAAERQGDFSGLRTAQNQPVTIYDPTTRAPFPGNRIPQPRISPVAAQAIAFYPQPNAPPLGPDNEGNYAQVTPSKNSYDSWNGKIDLRPTQRSSYSFRYAQTPWTNFSRIEWGTNAAEPSGENPSLRISRTWAADFTYTLSPTMFFNVRAGLARFEGFSGNTFAGGFDPRQLGFPSSLVGQFTAIQFPRFNMGTYGPLGATRVTQYDTNDNYSLTPNLSWIRGRHTMKYGVELRIYNRNLLQPGAASGSYDFGKRWTQQDPLRADALSGNEMATFLLGHPTGGFVDRNIDPAYQNKYRALFFQDDWKATRTLTLNFGLRWDYETPLIERFNRQIRGFGFDQASPIASRVQGLTLRGGLLFAGSSGEDRLAFLPDRNNFQPRVGVAWQIRPKWVVRGGYGLSYLGQHANGSNAGFSRPTSLIATTDNVTPAVTLSDPYPTRLFPSGLLLPIGSSQGLATNLGLGVGAQFLDRALPYSHQFSLGFQREVPWGFLIDGSYVGNITKKLPVGVSLNFIPKATLESLPVADRPGFFNAQVTNPLAGLLPGSAFNGATIPRSQTLVAYPHFAGVGISDVPIGSSRYDSFQLKATRRFAAGLAMQIAYTLSKNLEKVNILNGVDTDLGNLLNTALEKRLTEFDSPHLLAVVSSVELPVGKGKRFGGGMHPVLNGFLGNWNVNVQYVLRSGLLFNFPNAQNLSARSAKFNHAQRDELARNKGRAEFDPLYDVFFDTSLFPRQARAPFTLQQYSTRFADVRSKALNVWELSVNKEFLLFRRSSDSPIKLQLRGDAQNATNYPWFSRIQSVDVTNSRFGQLNPSARTEAREMVVSAKILF